MANIKKHVGRLRSTDARCVVVFMQLPNDESNSLIVDTDSLPDHLHDAFYRIVDSKEAQSEVDLGNLLSRRPSIEPNMDMLTYLHRAGRLKRVPVSNVMMYPFPNQPYPLEEIIKINGGHIEFKKAPDNTQNVDKFNPYLDRKRVEETKSRLDLATNKLKEAELLEQEAQKKREEAYSYFPQLRPGFIPNDSVSENLPEIDKIESTTIEEPVLSFEELGINPAELETVIIEEEIIPEVEEKKVESKKETRKSPPKRVRN